MKMRQVNVIDVNEWDSFVSSTYGRTYNFQQQDDCKPRQTVYFDVPVQYPFDFENDTVPEIVNHPEMGVSFKAWLERDPNKPLCGEKDGLSLEMWWERNFYPHLSMVAHDLHSRGLLPEGQYGIKIDW